MRRDVFSASARFADFSGILGGLMHPIADGLSADFIEVGGEGLAPFVEFRPWRHLDEAARCANHDRLAVHPRMAEVLHAVATAQSDEQLARQRIGM